MYSVAATTGTLSKTSSFTTDDSATSYYSPWTGVTITQPAQVATDITMTNATSIDSWCIKNYANINPVSQATTNFTYTAGVATTF
jgi:hypothetical protein